MELELYRRNSPFRFIEVEKNTSNDNINTNVDRVYDDEDLQLSPLMPSSPYTTTMLTLMPPPSPESPWTLSPHQTPSPSLLYHCIASLYRPEAPISSIAVSNHQGVVFAGSNSTRIHVWRQSDHVEYGCLKSTSGEVKAIAAHGNLLFTSHKDHKIRTWNFTVKDQIFKSKKIQSLPKATSFNLFSRLTNTNKHHQHKDTISCLAYYKTDGIVYTGSHDRTIKAWRLITSQCLDSFVAHEDNVNAIVVNQDDGCVFTCSADGSVKIWRRVFRENSHTLTMTLKKSQLPINALTLTLNASNHANPSCYLYSGASNGSIEFWEKERMTYRFNHGGFLLGHHFGVLCLVAIEKLVLSGSEDSTIRVWRREQEGCFHECLAVLEGHRGPVRCLAACLEIKEEIARGFLVYSGSLDQTLKVWRVKVSPEEGMGMMESYMDQNEIDGV